MITIAIANQKGGVGKTTSAVNIAAAATRSGLRVLLVDLDAQAGATRWLTDDWGPAGAIVGDVMRGDRRLADVILHTGPGIDLVPSQLQISNLDMQLYGKANSDGRLRLALQTVESRYDLALIDSPPWLGMITLNAFVAADAVLVPIDCRLQAMDAIPQLVEQIVSASEGYDRPIAMFCLPTFLERRLNLSKEVLAEIENRFGDHGTLPPINKNVALAEAYAARMTIFEYDRTSSGAVDYGRTTKELVNATLPKTTLRRIRQTAG